MTAPPVLFCMKGDLLHTHFDLADAVKCWGTPALYVFGGALPLTPSSSTDDTPTPTKSIPKRTGGEPRATLPQIKYVKKLDGDYIYAEYMDKYEASSYIDGLKHGRYATGKVDVLDEFSDKPRRWNADLTGPASIDEPPKWAAKRETIVPVELLEMVPDGYYATLIEEGAEPTFLRVKRPKFGTHADRLVVQTQHGDRLEDAFIVYPKTDIEGTRVDVLKVSVEEAILLLISDHYTAARRYGKLINKCARCNKELTDDRSRKYSIGPECEKHWPWMIDTVDSESEA